MQRVRRRRLDGTQEAYLIALVCSAPPDGSVRWMVRLLANQLVELGYVETIGYETVRQVLLANELKPWMKKQWCIPKSQNLALLPLKGRCLYDTRTKTIDRLRKRRFSLLEPLLCFSL